jgi:hypothetical protein
MLLDSNLNDLMLRLVHYTLNLYGLSFGSLGFITANPKDPGIIELRRYPPRVRIRLIDSTRAPGEGGIYAENGRSNHR